MKRTSFAFVFSLGLCLTFCNGFSQPVYPSRNYVINRNENKSISYRETNTDYNQLIDRSSQERTDYSDLRSPASSRVPDFSVDTPPVPVTVERPRQPVEDRLPEKMEVSKAPAHIMLSFVVDTDGHVIDVTVIDEADSVPDQATIRVISSTSWWEPGYRHDTPVRVRYDFPISAYFAKGLKEAL